MVKSNIYKRVERTFFILFTAILLLFIFISFFIKDGYSYFLGYAIGALSVFLTYKVNFMVSFFIFIRPKKSAFFFGFLKFLLVLLWWAIITIAIVQIDLDFHAYLKREADNSLWYTLAPINIFTYVFGASMIFISIMVAHIFEAIKIKKMKK
ncbi:hypothetical protein [Mycoplasmopsis gallinacea]|uniref:Uncharacterized protein n=1 Tax=Mycoplasmopsis gallinacea TaxID=29556 RepID=A0A449A2K2_9BACT|nr:hypothetical protein [Mycoplasmopsis gallinacea]QIW62621.1 hypothetical protein GOQ20_04400 [Mycoplasmopsis gallinacea]VEU58457.1 Uncharacterised protein [Mycoplasmopsis gallinacea]